MEINILEQKYKEKQLKPRHISDLERKKIAELEYDYWDNPKFPGYQGYKYDGRWMSAASKLKDYYGLNKLSTVLDIGCGKGFLLHDIHKVSGCEVKGLDKSQYAIDSSPSLVRDKIIHGDSKDLPFLDNEFDLVLCFSMLYALDYEDVVDSIKEIERVGKNKFIMVHTYTNDKERDNLEKYDATRKTMECIDGWKELFKKVGYTGDYWWTIYL